MQCVTEGASRSNEGKAQGLGTSAMAQPNGYDRDGDLNNVMEIYSPYFILLYFDENMWRRYLSQRSISGFLNYHPSDSVDIPPIND